MIIIIKQIICEIIIGKCLHHLNLRKSIRTFSCKSIEIQLWLINVEEEIPQLKVWWQNWRANKSATRWINYSTGRVIEFCSVVYISNQCSHLVIFGISLSQVMITPREWMTTAIKIQQHPDLQSGQNITVLSFVIEGVSFPLFWLQIKYKCNSISRSWISKYVMSSLLPLIIQKPNNPQK